MSVGEDLVERALVASRVLGCLARAERAASASATLSLAMMCPALNIATGPSRSVAAQITRARKKTPREAGFFEFSVQVVGGPVSGGMVRHPGAGVADVPALR